MMSESSLLKLTEAFPLSNDTIYVWILSYFTYNEVWVPMHVTIQKSLHAMFDSQFNLSLGRSQLNPPGFHFSLLVQVPVRLQIHHTGNHTWKFYNFHMNTTFISSYEPLKINELKWMTHMNGLPVKVFLIEPQPGSGSHGVTRTHGTVTVRGRLRLLPVSEWQSVSPHSKSAAATPGKLSGIPLRIPGPSIPVIQWWRMGLWHHDHDN